MADREQDHPSQRGAKGFFKRSISGDNSFYKDYAREVRAELNTVPRGELPFAWTMQTILGGGMLAIPGAAISAFAVFCFMNEKAPVDGGLHAVAEAGPGYQAVRFNDGQAFVLVTQNGHMSVFRQTDGNELTLIELRHRRWKRSRKFAAPWPGPSPPSKTGSLRGPICRSS